MHGDSREPNCPVCGSQALGKLASRLPFGRHTHSVLVCHISGRFMDENNLPMVLPNGHVYSQQALEQMASENDGMVTCPRTQETFQFADVRKMFLTS